MPDNWPTHTHYRRDVWYFEPGHIQQLGEAWLMVSRKESGDHCHHETQACSDFLLDDQVSVYLLTVMSIQRLCVSPWTRKYWNDTSRELQVQDTTRFKNSQVVLNKSFSHISRDWDVFHSFSAVSPHHWNPVAAKSYLHDKGMGQWSRWSPPHMLELDPQNEARGRNGVLV